MRTKTILLLLFIFSNLSLIAQNNFQNAFKNKNRPSIENVRVNVADDKGNESFIPITIIKGKKEGPVFTIISGVHGYEYPPIIAVQQMLKELKPEKLAGTLIIVPIANVNSFYTRTPFINPADKVNLNRTFPGKKTGTVTEKIADFITTDIIAISDVFLDIHGGDASEDLMPFVCYYNNEGQPEETHRAMELAEISGFEYVVKYPYTLMADKPAKYAFKQAVQDGKTALSIECGKLGNVQKEAVALIKIGIFNMLHKMKMYHKNSNLKKKPIQLNGQAYVRSDTKGIFYSEYKAGDTLEKGAIVGYITDEFGSVISEFKAPHSGIIMYKIGTPPVNVDETLMCIGYTVKN